MFSRPFLALGLDDALSVRPGYLGKPYGETVKDSVELFIEDEHKTGKLAFFGSIANHRAFLAVYTAALETAEASLLKGGEQ